MVEAAIAQKSRLSPRDSHGRGKDPGQRALDPRRLHPRVQPVVRRRLGPQRRLARDPRQLRRRRSSKCSGSSTPIFCRCPRCCCLAARSAIISGGGACWSSARACSRSPRCVCALAPSLPVLLAARAAQGIGAALLLPNSLALLNAAFSGREARSRGRDLGRGRRRRRRDRAADRRLAGRHRRLAGDLLHQPAARAGRDPAGGQVRRRKPQPGRGPNRLCRSLARDRRARRAHLRSDLLVGIGPVRRTRDDRWSRSYPPGSSRRPARGRPGRSRTRPSRRRRPRRWPCRRSR